MFKSNEEKRKIIEKRCRRRYGCEISLLEILLDEEKRDCAVRAKYLLEEQRSLVREFRRIGHVMTMHIGRPRVLLK